MGRFCLLVELHREGSASAAWAAGLFKTNLDVSQSAISSCCEFFHIWLGAVHILRQPKMGAKRHVHSDLFRKARN